jgi:PPK2 family polyphosphate:nucleotide phosphotransferase
MTLHKTIKRFCVQKPKKFQLDHYDPNETGGLSLDKDTVKPLLEDGIKRLSDLQQRLYAQDRWAVLIIFQAMDAAGKDSCIKHVMSGVNPQGCEVHSFKAPTPEELEHEFLWRASIRLPGRGRIGIFNRSYYEEVLVTRVHQKLLEHERLPHIEKHIWKHRMRDICAFEQHLTSNGVIILKFHLRISKEEQRQRFLARLDEPSKHWKFSMNDVTERRQWDHYMTAYEEMIRGTSTAEAPWYVIPANHKWFAWLMVAEAIVDALENLDLKFPAVKGKTLAEMKKARRALLAEEAKSKHGRP